MDACLSDIWLHKDVDAFAQLFHLILSENVSGELSSWGIFFEYMPPTTYLASLLCLVESCRLEEV